MAEIAVHQPTGEPADAPYDLTAGMSFDAEPISPYDPRDAGGRRAMVLLAVTFGGLLLLAILVFSLWGDGTRTRDEIPLARVDERPFKTVPEDEGGMQAENQDREVFGRIDGSGSGDVDVMPEPEEPLAPELPDRMEVEVQPVVPMPQPARPTPPKPEPARPAPTPAPSRQPTQAASASPVAGGSSDWVVQIASLRSEGEAADAYGRMSRKFAAVLPSTAYADIVRADLGDKGVYYRARVAGLESRTAANRLCSTFKSGNQACFVAKK